jgi:hypothetical protein
MSKQYRRSVFMSGNRDENESKITAILDRYHIPWCKMPPLAGFDLLVFVGPLECWEVKNPSYKWTLTKAEQERKSYCKQNGITYRVIEFMDQAVDAITERITA